ncbi:MAG: antibiotic biosynthesis monooxygenase family protein [Thermoanaerobaculia bacterium]
MFLRIIRLRVREADEAAFTRFYENRVMPALDATSGCLYAGLLAPWRGGEAHQSLTIWDSPESASAYEEKGLYHQLLQEAAPFLSERTEWRIRLATDPLETTDPSRREIPSSGYNVDEVSGSESLDSDRRSSFVRIVSLRVDPDHVAEFLEIYREKVIPALRAVPGCRGIFLAEGAHDPNGVLSITLWNREEDAVRYEMSGLSEQLTAHLRGTISPAYDWRLTLDSAGSGGGGLDVSSFQLVRGRRLDTDSSGVKPE